MRKTNTIIPKALWWLAYVLLLACLGYLPHYYNLHLGYSIAIPVVVAMIENSFAYFQKHVSLFFARKFLTMSIALIGILIVAVVLPRPPLNKPIPIIQFALQGLVVGITLRELLLNMSLNNLFGEAIDVQRLLFLGGMVIFLLLMPLDSPHGSFLKPYVLGLGMGLFVHFLLRRLFQRGADVSRRGKILLGMLMAENEVLSDVEKVSINYFIARRWRRLRKLYLKYLERATTLSAKMAIIESCMCRIRGEYDLALRTIDKVAESESVDTYVRGLLQLQEGLVLSELGRDKEMYEALEQSMKNNPKCFLSSVTYALHLAEEIPLRKEHGNVDVDAKRPLNLIREALEVNANERNTELLSNLIGHSVPLSWGFIHDAYGYALLKAGDFSFSKGLFLDCIRKEPHLVSAYLHLGEWYLAYCLNRKSSSERLTLAKLCFSIALSLEGRRPSRIAKRAKKLSEDVDSLVSAPAYIK
jgi:tetratricopeptide (TPR) repeat protein